MRTQIEKDNVNLNPTNFLKWIAPLVERALVGSIPTRHID